MSSLISVSQYKLFYFGSVFFMCYLDFLEFCGLLFRLFPGWGPIASSIRKIYFQFQVHPARERKKSRLIQTIFLHELHSFEYLQELGWQRLYSVCRVTCFVLVLVLSLFCFGFGLFFFWVLCPVNIEIFLMCHFL